MSSIAVAYPFTVETLAAQVDCLRGHSFGTPTLYRDGVKAIAQCRTFRVQIEERRKLLKQDSIDYGRKVDAVAKQLVEIIEAVEEPLKAAKVAVDTEKQRAKEAEAAAERKRLEDELRAQRAAEEAELRAQRKAEETELTKQRAELKAYQDQVAKEREEAAEAMRLERAALQAERDAAAKELAEIRARKAREAAEREAKELAERMAAEAEEKRIHQLEWEESQRKRLAALKPDKDKLTQMARSIRTLCEQHAEWEFSSDEGCKAADEALEIMMGVAKGLEGKP